MAVVLGFSGTRVQSVSMRRWSLCDRRRKRRRIDFRRITGLFGEEIASRRNRVETTANVLRAGSFLRVGEPLNCPARRSASGDFLGRLAATTCRLF